MRHCRVSRTTGATRLWAWTLLLLLAVLPAWGRQLPELTAWPHEQSDLKPDPNVVWGRLESGMRYVLMPNDTPKGRISLRLMVAAGSLMETDEQRGLAHFLEHMAFKGSENMPAGDLVQYLERLGMAFGADTNARTSFETTVYQLELPSNDTAMIDKSLMVMRETADRLLIAAADLERERGVILSEKRLRNTPDYRGFSANLAFLLPKSLVPQRFPIGEDSVIEGAPRERLVNFYRTWYRPERLTLIAVGAMDPARFTEHIVRSFGSVQARVPARPNPEIGSMERRPASARFYSDPDAQTRVTLQTVTDADPGADTHASRARDAALYLANGVLTRRLDRLSRQAEATFLNGGADVDDLLRFARIGAVSMQSRPEQWKAALATAEQELRRALTYGFTAAELDEQRKNLLSGLEQQARSASTRESPRLANDLVDHLTNFDVFTSPQADLEEFERLLPEITPAKAQRELQALWSGGGPLVFVSGPMQLKDPEAEILKALADSRTRPVTPPQDGKEQTFAYTDFGPPTPVVEKKVTSAMEVTQIRFGNNVRLNLKPTKFDANTILVGIRIGGGRLELPRDKPGLQLLADRTFVSAGLEKHSLDELNGITAGRNVGIDFSVEDDAFVLSGHTTPADLLLQLQVLAAYVTAPGYRPEALERFRQSLEPLYRNILRTPGGVLQSEVARFLHDGDPRFGYPPREEAARRTLEELKAWLARPLGSEYLEISLVGDFDPDAALQAVASTFGALPTREANKAAYTEERKVRFPGRRELHPFSFESGDSKSYASVYWPTTDYSQTSDVRRLFVFAKVLEGRVLERIRIKQGLSYSAQAGHAPSMAFPGYGLLYSLVDSTPEKAAGLALEIRDIADQLVREGATPDEVERARNPIVNELRKRLMDNGYLMAMVVIASQEQPERLVRATTAVPDLESIGVDDVAAVARKYIKRGEGLPITVVPVQPPAKSSRAAPLPRAAALAH
jgi:zinc protease